MLPVINAFKTAHQLTDVTVVADAGMISEANQKAIIAAELSFILGTRIPYVPQIIAEWRDKHPIKRSPMGRCSPNRGQPPPPRRPAASLIG